MHSMNRSAHEYNYEAMGHYDVAQICLNGHVVNAQSKASPQFNEDFCSQCGSETITECPVCKTPIRGYLHVEGVPGFYDMEAPGYCYSCGRPYPWTASRLAAARELADELDQLSSEERALLKSSLDDLVRNTPKTELASLRFKKFMQKAGRDAAMAFKNLLVDIVSEAAKKSIWP